MFFFAAPRGLRAPSADRRETLPSDRKVLPHDDLDPTILGTLKNLKAKNVQNLGRLRTTSNFDREYLRNERIYLKSWSTAIPPAFGETFVRSTNNTVLHVDSDPPKSTFFKIHISAPMCDATFFRQLLQYYRGIASRNIRVVEQVCLILSILAYYFVFISIYLFKTVTWRFVIIVDYLQV